MVTLDDTDLFAKVLSVKVPWVYTWGGKTDRERREAYRRAASESISQTPADALWWAFRITVEKASRSLDVDNVAKLIIDAFCAWQIAKDGSSFVELGLYPNDTFDHVRILQVVGGRNASTDSTFIEVFARIRE